MKTLKPFQSEAVTFLTTRRNALLADEMGLGKTLSTLHSIEMLCPKHVLIVCPASIKEQWAKEIRKETCFLPEPIQILQGRNAHLYKKIGVVIVNYDLLSCEGILNQLTAIKWDVGVYDEVHYCKSLDAKRTKAVFGKGGLVHCCNRNILLTGTPVLNRPIELYPMLKVLAPDVCGKENTYEKFGIKFCRGWYDGFQLNVQGASNEEELNSRLKRSGFMLRRLEKDVESQLPAKRFQIFMVDGEGTCLHELERMEGDSFRKQRIGTDVHIATLRRELAEKKAQKSLEQIKDIVAQVGKLVIFCYHKSVVDMLMAELDAVKIDGSCSQSQRKAALEAFKTNKNVLIGQITAAGQGLDGMQEVCNHVLFLEISWTPAEIQQAIARVHRMGQTKSCLVQFIVWAKSVEEHMMRTILDKQDTIKRILE